MHVREVILQKRKHVHEFHKPTMLLFHPIAFIRTITLLSNAEELLGMDHAVLRAEHST